MVTLHTERLILVSTPLHVIEMRLEQGDFTAEIVVAPTPGHEMAVLPVFFPSEWPGDAEVLLPVWRQNLLEDPGYEMLGGTIIEHSARVAVGQMTFRILPYEAGTVELGYGINAGNERKGYATEMARALVAWALDQKSITRIVSECLVDNIGSIRVLEKTGFQRIGSRRDDEGEFILWEFPREP